MKNDRGFNEEERTLKGAALLDVEEAKLTVAALRARAENWRKRHQNLAFFLDSVARHDADSRTVGYDYLLDIENDREALSRMVNLQPIIELQGEMQVALERLEKAEAKKKELGFV